MKQENQNLEYKRIWNDEYLKWICGFANAKGGTIYIGIDDNGNVCGISNSHKQMEDIPNKIVAYLGIVADVYLHQKDNMEYIEIVVNPSNVPILYKGVFYYRSGATKQELKGATLQRFILKYYCPLNIIMYFQLVEIDELEDFLSHTSPYWRFASFSGGGSDDTNSISLRSSSGLLKNVCILR